MASTATRTKFHIEIIKPSHYDDDGYVIQWLRTFVPSNSLACLHALVKDAQARNVLGADVDITLHACDEIHAVVSTKKVVQRIRQAGGRGIVFLVGVQSNQFPRAVDLAREIRAAGIDVVVGGFHVSGCLSMLPEIPPDIRALQDEGIVLFAGEAEQRIEELLKDAYRGELQPVYNFLKDLPDLKNQVLPMLPLEIVRGYLSETSFDAGRGCPFQCSFCTIINVQGRKSRYRTADDVEQIIRANLAQGVHKFFITDDDFARNKNWEAIFDRMIDMREQQGLHFKYLMQVDTQCYKIPRFIDKAARAGCSRVFIGMESIAPENLAAAGKVQNHVEQYRRMLQMWRDKKVVTIAGYILGFPADTPASIARDIATIQRELPIDMLEFFCLTPLPGSADHQALYRKGVPMDPDMNNYDLEHVTTDHPRMSPAEWRGIYDRAWSLYYSADHIAKLLRRARADGIKLTRITWSILFYYGAYRFERVHPLQCGVFRRKVRTSRRPSLPRVNPLVFYPKRLWEIVSTYSAMALFFGKLELLRRRIEREPGGEAYTDEAIERSPYILPLPVVQQQATPQPHSAEPVVISISKQRRAA